jgi:IS605 OrfB family transposase
MSEHVRTVRVEIYPIAGDVDRKRSWERTYDILSNSYKFANEIIREQFFNDYGVDIISRRIRADKKRMELITNLGTKNTNLVYEEKYGTNFTSHEAFKDKDYKKEIEFQITKLVNVEVEKMFVDTYGVGVKLQASPEKSVKKEFPTLPSCVTNCMNQVVYSSYNAAKKDYKLGKTTLRTYKEGMPVSIHDKAITISKQEDTFIVEWNLGTTYNHSLKYQIRFGRDKANNRLTFQRIIDKEIKKGACQLQLKDKKLFLLLPVYDAPKAEALPHLDPNISAGIDLGINTPAYIALADGTQSLPIGSKETFLKQSLQLSDRRRRLQKELALIKGGHGRSHKLKALERIKDHQHNFASNLNHAYSKAIVEWCVKNHVGVLKMEELTGISKSKTTPTNEEPNAIVTNHQRLLKNWSYFALQTFIIYKAKRMGIKVVKINPKNTSKVCSKCGAIGTRDPKDKTRFYCECESYVKNADLNAAINIARSTEIVKEC